MTKTFTFAVMHFTIAFHFHEKSGNAWNDAG